jgi:predicted ATPase
MVPVLVDRAMEAEAIERLLAAVRDGLSGVLVLRGDPGIGKTALLDYAVENAGDMQVARVTGVESEMDLGFAGLHQLLIPFLGGLERLPVPQREALGSAFGMTAGPPPDRFLVGLAALTLITDLAVERPVLCVIDDAQWLDQVSVEVLGFVARRLFADRVGMLFAVREGEQRAVMLDGLSELTIGALPEDAAGELLADTVGRPVDQQTGALIVAEAAGNPLALVEFAHELTEAELAGAAPLGRPLRFGGRLQKLYRSRVQALPEQAQLLLLVVAADQLGDPGKVWRAGTWRSNRRWPSCRRWSGW